MEATWISKILLPTISLMSQNHFWTPQAIHGNLEGDQMSWWSFLMGNIWTWPLHSWLSQTSLAIQDCLKLVSQVGLLVIILSVKANILRCDALQDNLDRPGSHRRSHEKTDFLIKNFDPGILWDKYGICNDIVECLSLFSMLWAHFSYKNSPSLTHFHMHIFISSCHPIFYTN